MLTLTIDRPDAKNALTLAMRQWIEQLAREVDGDDAVDVVVLTAVDPVFSAGADIKEIVALGPSLTPTNPGAALRSIGKPVIAAVNGACVTGGLELVLSCDIVIASERARFADTHAKLGALPRWGMSALLPRAVGPRQGEGDHRDRCVRRRRRSAAHRVGQSCGPARRARGAARTSCVRRSSPANQRAVRASIDLYDRGNGLSLADALALEVEVGGAWTVDTSTFGQ